MTRETVLARPAKPRLSIAGGLVGALLLLIGAPLTWAGPGGCPASSWPDDYDGICHLYDNCPRVPNRDQGDANGDGVGDVCQCGDVTGDGQLTLADWRSIKRCVKGKVSCDRVALCDVDGDADCDKQDSALIQGCVSGEFDCTLLTCALKDGL